jgi:hypothetical protein
MNNGKRKCEFLKGVRLQVAEQYDLRYEPRECHHEGDCQGTCPLCDAELEDLQRQLKEKGIVEVAFNESLNKETDEFMDNQAETCVNNDDVRVLQGDVRALPERNGSIAEKRLSSLQGDVCALPDPEKLCDDMIEF